MADVVTSHNSDQHRYEARVDGELAGFIQYRESVGLVNLFHTEVDDRFEGRGLGSRLAAGALDAARAAGDPVVPLCPFIASYIERHPEYDDVVDHELLARFGDAAGA